MFVCIMDLTKIFPSQAICTMYTNICRGNLMMGQLLKPNANIHKHFKIQTSVFSSSSSATFPSIFKPTITPNPTTIAETLSQLLKQNPKLPHITQIHTQIITHSLSSKAHLITALICSYISSKNLNSARILFDRFPSPSPFTLLWNLMIQGYSKKPNSQESLDLFRRMHGCSIPDKYTFTFVITACSHQPKPMFGKSIHGWVLKVGCEYDIFVGNSLLNFYSIFGEMEEAQKVFNEMPQRDVVSWTSLISGYTKCGEIDRAIELFCKVPERSDISWVVMISGFVANGRYTEALRYFNDMLSDDKVKPNEAVLVCVLSACAHLGALDQGKWIHVYIDRIGIPKSSNISTALIDMYSKCGRIDCADRVFNDIPKRDVLTWTSMITGLSMHGLGKDALQVFYQMLAEGVKPDHITLLGVLNGCSHSGLVEEGCSIFDDMKRSWGVCPEIEHYGCLIDLLGRAGKLQRAFEIVKSMPLKPDIVVWRALLSACRIHGNVSLGEEIIDHVEELDSSVEGGGYVLLSNLYASFGRWDKVARVRKEMNERKVELNPGWSWIEIDGTVHEFLAADRSHPQITEIHEKLNQVLNRASIEGGYVANTKQALFDLSEEEKEQAISWHSEKLAVAFGLMSTDPGTPIRIVKNLRICEDCHSAMKAISRVFSREIVVRDRSRFHTFIEGKCSCKDYW